MLAWFAGLLCKITGTPSSEQRSTAPCGDLLSSVAKSVHFSEWRHSLPTIVSHYNIDSWLSHDTQCCNDTSYILLVKHSINFLFPYSRWARSHRSFKRDTNNDKATVKRLQRESTVFQRWKERLGPHGREPVLGYCSAHIHKYHQSTQIFNTGVKTNFRE